MHIPFASVIPFRGFYSKEIIECTQKLHYKMFIAKLFIKARIGNNLNVHQQKK